MSASLDLSSSNLRPSHLDFSSFRMRSFLIFSFPSLSFYTSLFIVSKRSSVYAVAFLGAYVLGRVLSVGVLLRNCPIALSKRVAAEVRAIFKFLKNFIS